MVAMFIVLEGADIAILIKLRKSCVKNTKSMQFKITPKVMKKLWAIPRLVFDLRKVSKRLQKSCKSYQKSCEKVTKVI